MGRFETRLFHAVVLGGLALGAGCGGTSGVCQKESGEAGADAAVTLGPCDDAAVDAHRMDAMPDVDAWPPTKS